MTSSFRLDKATYLSAFHTDTQKIVESAQQGLEAPVPSCPGWNLGYLLGHVGSIYAVLVRTIGEGKGEDIVHELKDLRLPPEIHAWFEAKQPQNALPASLLDWFEDTVRSLESVFQAA